jgi:hypothetical protein
MEDKEKTTVRIQAEVLKEMKAEEELMKLNMSNLTDQLEEAQAELKTTKEALKSVSKDLRDTKNLLHIAVEMRYKAEETTAQCEKAMKNFVNRWLTEENQARMTQMLKLYHPADRIKMMNALLTYLIFGAKKRMDREVEKTHFDIICEKIDEDSVTLPVHSMMVKLMKKYGLLEKIPTE